MISVVRGSSIPRVDCVAVRDALNVPERFQLFIASVIMLVERPVIVRKRESRSEISFSSLSIFS